MNKTKTAIKAVENQTTITELYLYFQNVKQDVNW